MRTLGKIAATCPEGGLLFHFIHVSRWGIRRADVVLQLPNACAYVVTQSRINPCGMSALGQERTCRSAADLPVLAAPRNEWSLSVA